MSNVQLPTVYMYLPDLRQPRSIRSAWRHVRGDMMHAALRAGARLVLLNE